MCSSVYGRDRVAQIITFGTLQARAVLRDVGRVLQMPTGPGRPSGQDDPGQSGQSGDPGPGHCAGAAPARGARR